MPIVLLSSSSCSPLTCTGVAQAPFMKGQHLRYRACRSMSLHLHITELRYATVDWPTYVRLSWPSFYASWTILRIKGQENFEKDSPWNERLHGAGACPHAWGPCMVPSCCWKRRIAGWIVDCIVQGSTRRWTLAHCVELQSTDWYGWVRIWTGEGYDCV